MKKISEVLFNIWCPWCKKNATAKGSTYTDGKRASSYMYQLNCDSCNITVERPQPTEFSQIRIMATQILQLIEKHDERVN